MRGVNWSDEAISDLMQIADYIDQFNPPAAARLSVRLIEAVATLAEFPDRGRRRNDGFRELVAVSPYVVRYRVEDGEVRIYGVRHGARRPL